MNASNFGYFSHLVASAFVCHKVNAHHQFANSTYFTTSALVLKFSVQHFLQQFNHFSVKSKLLLKKLLYVCVKSWLQEFFCQIIVFTKEVTKYGEIVDLKEKMLIFAQKSWSHFIAFFHTLHCVNSWFHVFFRQIKVFPKEAITYLLKVYVHTYVCM